jgi:hypothetical protein
MEEPKNAEDHEEDELDDSVQGTQLPDVNEGSGDEFQLTQLPRVPAVEISRNGGDTRVLRFEGDAEQKIDIGRRAGASDKEDKIILTGEGVAVSRCHAQLKCLPDGRVLVVTSIPHVYVKREGEEPRMLPKCPEGTQRFLDQGDEITVGLKRLPENTIKVVTCAPAHQNTRSAEAEARRATAAAEHRRPRPGPAQHNRFAARAANAFRNCQDEVQSASSIAALHDANAFFNKTLDEIRHDEVQSGQLKRRNHKMHEAQWQSRDNMARSTRSARPRSPSGNKRARTGANSANNGRGGPAFVPHDAAGRARCRDHHIRGRCTRADGCKFSHT